MLSTMLKCNVLRISLGLSILFFLQRVYVLAVAIVFVYTQSYRVIPGMAIYNLMETEQEWRKTSYDKDP